MAQQEGSVASGMLKPERRAASGFQAFSEAALPIPTALGV
jgi:hypothetical protein